MVSYFIGFAQERPLVKGTINKEIIKSITFPSVLSSSIPLSKCFLNLGWEKMKSQESLFLKTMAIVVYDNVVIIFYHSWSFCGCVMQINCDGPPSQFVEGPSGWLYFHNSFGAYLRMSNASNYQEDASFNFHTKSSLTGNSRDSSLQTQQTAVSYISLSHRIRVVWPNVLICID